MKRNDLILLLSVLLLAAIALAVLYAIYGNRGAVAIVTVDGEEILRLDLNENTEVWVEGYQGGSNLVVIEDGKASVREASCPDRVCVHTGEADALRSIVCAPNRLVVRIEE